MKRSLKSVARGQQDDPRYFLKIILKIEDGESNDGEGKNCKGSEIIRYEKICPDTTK